MLVGFSSVATALEVYSCDTLGAALGIVMQRNIFERTNGGVEKFLNE